MFYGAQIAEAINSYAPAYGFDVEVKKIWLREISRKSSSLHRSNSYLLQ